MKKWYVLLFAVFLYLVAPSANAALENFRTFTAEGANISIDAVGLNTSEMGNIQAELPTDGVVEAAYLYSASIWSFSALANVVFDGATQTSSAASRLDVGSKDANPASENRWDVTSIVKPKLDPNDGAGPINFSVTELGDLAGEILAVLYSVSSEPVQTAFIFDGELATTGDTFNINLSDSFDGSDAIFSLGISHGFQGTDQFTQVDVNGERLTTSAGGQDDGFNQNSGLITAGGIGDLTDNPANPLAGPNGDPRFDDELYNLASLLDIGDNLISISTLNPSNDDNIFFAALVTRGEATVGPAIPEPATMLLLGSGILGLAWFRKKFNK